MGVVQMDCRNWDEEAYRDSILQERETLSRTIFRTVFAPTRNLNPNSDLIVTASSDDTVASYSISSCLALGCGNVGGQYWLVAEPHCLIQGHNGRAYDVKFSGNEDPLLLSDLHYVAVAMMVRSEDGNGKKFWNVWCLCKGGSICAAAGDSCAYCWDVEKSEIKMVFKGHSNYLYCVVARNSCNQIITGSEDGTARIWDCRSGKCIQVIDPGKDKTIKESVPCVSCIALDASESWLILAVGTAPSLTRFDMKGDILSQIHCAPQSAFSVSLNPSGVVTLFSTDEL